MTDRWTFKVIEGQPASDPVLQTRLWDSFPLLNKSDGPSEGSLFVLRHLRAIMPTEGVLKMVTNYLNILVVSGLESVEPNSFLLTHQACWRVITPRACFIGLLPKRLKAWGPVALDLTSPTPYLWSCSPLEIPPSVPGSTTYPSFPCLPPWADTVSLHSQGRGHEYFTMKPGIILTY